jgi:hypothetical protein
MAACFARDALGEGRLVLGQVAELNQLATPCAFEVSRRVGPTRYE